MGAKGKSYQIVATNKPKLAGWNTISKTKMETLYWENCSKVYQ